MKHFSYALPTLALAGAAILMVPGKEAAGWSTIGGSLGAEGQRDFRVHNNFQDAAANNNTIADPMFPGFDGAEDPARAETLYEHVAACLRARGLPVETGRFGARMQVELVNDGPVTFLIETRNGTLLR